MHFRAFNAILGLVVGETVRTDLGFESLLAARLVVHHVLGGRLLVGGVLRCYVSLELSLIFELHVLLEILDQSSPVLWHLSWGPTQWLPLLMVDLGEDLLASLAFGHEINHVKFAVGQGLLWVFDYSFLGAGLDFSGLLDWALLRLEGRVVDLGLLLLGVEAVEHFSHVGFAPKLLVHVCVVD